MMDNPYSPPQSDLEVVERNHCWRESDSILYVSKDSDIPQRCVKCNGSISAPAKLKAFYWHASGWYLLVLFNILIYAIVAFFIRKKIKVSPGLCDAHKKRRNTFVLGSLGLAIVLFMAGVVFAGGDTVAFSLVGFIGSFVALVASILAARTIYPIEINARGARFKGCGKAFLRSLALRDARNKDRIRFS